MRLAFVLQTSNDALIKLPLDYRRYFISLTKTLLSKSKLFSRFSEKKPGMSPYSIGFFFKSAAVNRQNNKITIQPPITFYISSSYTPAIIDVYNQALAFKQSEKPVLNNLMISSINILNRSINTNKINFFVHDVIFKKSNDTKRYIENINVEDFEIVVNDYLLGKIVHYNEFYKTNLSFVPIKCNFLDLKKIPCLHYGAWLPVYSGSVQLAGSPEVLQFIFENGLGVRTGQGFGFIDLLKKAGGMSD